MGTYHTVKRSKAPFQASFKITTVSFLDLGVFCVFKSSKRTDIRCPYREKIEASALWSFLLLPSDLLAEMNPLLQGRLICSFCIDGT